MGILETLETGGIRMILEVDEAETSRESTEIASPHDESAIPPVLVIRAETRIETDTRNHRVMTEATDILLTIRKAALTAPEMIGLHLIWKVSDVIGRDEEMIALRPVIALETTDMALDLVWKAIDVREETIVVLHPLPVLTGEIDVEKNGTAHLVRENE
jgi:hypothetical protein